MRRQSSQLEFLDDLVAEGVRQFSFAEALRRSGRSPTATANFLRRMAARGLLDRVTRGHYVVRLRAVRAPPAAAENIALAVGAGFAGTKHRISYRTALDEHDLTSHPGKTIQVACVKRTHAARLSSRPLRVIIEPEAAIAVG